jgi:hypothetical protein
MLNAPDDLARNHVDSINALNEYLLECCPDRFNSEMQARVQAIFISFREFCGVTPDHGQLLDLRYDSALGRNYIVAQCSLLLAFAHVAAASAERNDVIAVQRFVEKLWEDLSKCYNAFFGLPFFRGPQ